MDLSALIFVALAVAWAVYLVPKAIRHHDEAGRSRSVDRFSGTMRVLARREAVNARDTRLVVSPGRSTPTTTVTAEAPLPAPDVIAPPASTVNPAVRRRAAARAAARRRRVLGVVLLALAAVVTLAATGVVAWAWTAVPAALVVAWLTACRLMVRASPGRSAVGSPRRARRADARAEKRALRREARTTPGDEVDADLAEGDDRPLEEFPEVEDDGDDTQEVPVVPAGPGTSPHPAEAGFWDPVPVTLPTYVGKAPAAPRTVRTIDLDSTGVWTSGRSEADSALAREAEQIARAEKAEQVERDRAADKRRATGS